MKLRLHNLFFIVVLCFIMACESSTPKDNTPIQTETSVLQNTVNITSTQALPRATVTPQAPLNQNCTTLFLKQEFLFAQVSPNGKYVLTSQEGYVGLKIYQISPEKLFATISEDKRIGFGAQWSVDSKKVFYKEKINSEFKAFIYDLERGIAEELKDVNPNALQSYALAEKPTDPIIFLNPKTLQVEKTTFDGKAKTTITNDGGQYYNPLLSPDKQKLIIQEGSKMYLLFLEDRRKIEIGNGIASCWSPDSKNLYYFLDESKDGHEITGSEIYRYNTEKNTSTAITKTPDIAEMWPSISSDGKFLFCTDDLTGQILKISLL